MNNLRTRNNKGGIRFPRKSNTNRRQNRKNNNSTIDPNSLVKKATSSEQSAYEAFRSFDDMPIHKSIKANLTKLGFDTPTQIQDKTLENLQEGNDIVGVANTGTGKTGAFLIPIMDQLLNRKTGFQSLVVVPTRELAQQVTEEFKTLSKGTGLTSACFIGGTSVGKDMGQLRKNNDIIIGTPGRLIDLADRGGLKLKDFTTLVLDEFDRMLDMGFIQDIKKMVQAMEHREQTMLFSATLDKTQQSLISELLDDPVEVKINTKAPASGQIEQDIVKVPADGDKFDMLLKLMDDKTFEKVLLFAETKRSVEKISNKLHKSGVKVEFIHGDKTQNHRVKALDQFKSGKVRVLVATDVAARGIDVTDITHVINYQMPANYDSYVHRIGRTGRAGKSGKALTFVE